MGIEIAFDQGLHPQGVQPLGLQLFTVGDAFRSDMDSTLDHVARIGYQTVELPGLPRGEAERTRRSADRAGLKVTSVHIPAQELPTGANAGARSMNLSTDIMRVADDLQVLGAKSLVVPLPTMPDVQAGDGESAMEALTRGFRAQGGAHWKAFANQLNEFAAVLKSAGITLSYHNHNFEFAPFAETSGWTILTQYTEPDLVFFELDVAWAEAAGLVAAALIRDHKGRVRQLHLKDILATTRPNFSMELEATAVGDGRIDWQALLGEATLAGIGEFYVEHEPPFKIPPFESIERSFRYISTLG